MRQLLSAVGWFSLSISALAAQDVNIMVDADIEENVIVGRGDRMLFMCITNARDKHLRDLDITEDRRGPMCPLFDGATLLTADGETPLGWVVDDNLNNRLENGENDDRFPPGQSKARLRVEADPGKGGRTINPKEKVILKITFSRPRTESCTLKLTASNVHPIATTIQPGVRRGVNRFRVENEKLTQPIVVVCSPNETGLPIAALLLEAPPGLAIQSVFEFDPVSGSLSELPTEMCGGSVCPVQPRIGVYDVGALVAIAIEYSEFAPGEFTFVDITPAVVGPGQVPGDANFDGRVHISDGIFLLLALFASEGGVELPCEGEMLSPQNQMILDWTGDGRIDLSDALATFRWLFLSGDPHARDTRGSGTTCLTLDGCVDSCR